MTATIFSVSYLATRSDNGHCLSFWSRAEAEVARRELIEAGCFYVSEVWS